MKLNEYIIHLNKIAEQYPDVEVVYAKDGEGNSFSPVGFTPTLGNFEGRDFISDDGTEEFESKINAVCLN